MGMNKSSKAIAVWLVVLILASFLPAGMAYAGKYVPDLSESGNVVHVSDYYPSVVIDDFNLEDSVNQPGKWSKGTGTGAVRYVSAFSNSPKAPYEGGKVLEVVSGAVKAYEWRTAYKEFHVPLDLSSVNYLTFAVNCYGWKNEDYMIRTTLYSGTAEPLVSYVKIGPNKWNKIGVSLSGWEHKNAITKMEFAFMLNYDLEGMSPGEPGYQSWGGNYQLDYISGSNTLDMEFNQPGDTEGFAALDAQLQAADGALRMTVNGPAPVLEFPVMKKDAAVYNTLVAAMKNLSAYSKLRIWWTTEADPQWTPGKTELFDLASGGNPDYYVDKAFNFSGNPEWQGLIRQIRLEFLEGSGASGDIHFDKFFLKQLPPVQVYPGEVDDPHIQPDGEHIQIEGIIKPTALSGFAGGRIALFELQPYEQEEALEGRTPAAVLEQAQPSFSFQLPLRDNGRSRLFSKFAVAVIGTDGGYALLDRAKYLTNPEQTAANTFPFPERASKKGLQVQMYADAEELGISHAALNVYYNSALYISGAVNPANTYEYSYEGETFYFRRDWIANLDNAIKSLSDNRITVSLILLMKRDLNPDTPNQYLLHPDADESANIFAFNTTDAQGMKYYSAVTGFLAERYTRTDQKYGRAVNFIVGNEVDMSKSWYNMGSKLIGELVEDYARTVRITNTAVKSRYSNARVYISLTHNWDYGLPPTATGNYDGRAIVDQMLEEMKQHGDIPWNIAYHPYPENLLDPKVWNAPNSVSRFDTDQITFKNLHVLTDYMKQPEYLYKGQPRRIILSEQGFHSGDNTPANQQIQAAAYAYAYYTTQALEGIDSFILHRQVDHAQEGGLNLGLWSHDPDISQIPNIPYEKKYLFDIFTKIDTDESLAVTAFAKPIIGIDSWTKIAPALNEQALALRNSPQEAEGQVIDPALLAGTTLLDSFEESAGGWSNAEYVSNVQIDKAVFLTGAGSLRAALVSSGAGQIGESKGVAKVFPIPLDASGSRYLYAGVHPSSGPDGGSYKAKVKLYSGNHILESEITVEPKEWSTIAVDMGNWQYRNAIDKIKIWLRPAERILWGNGFFHVDDIGLAEAAVTPEESPLSIPGKPVLSHDNGHDTGLQDGDYHIFMNLWWGENAGSFRLYENGVEIASEKLNSASPQAQSAAVAVQGRANGTYRYYAEWINGKGIARSDELVVEVTQAAPSVPQLASDNWENGGSYRITMNLWWGQNGSAYKLYENGILIDTQSLEKRTPGAQSAVTVISDRQPGVYEYRCELINAAGISSSETLTVTVREGEQAAPAAFNSGP